MYIYYFNKKNGHGKSDDLYVFEVTKYYESFRRFKNQQKLYYVLFDAQNCLNRETCFSKNTHRKTGLSVPVEEGCIFKRIFWLEEYNVEKGEAIIKEYKKKKAEEYRKKYEKYLED